MSPHIKPERYRLMVHPDLNNFTFRCEETIYFKIFKPTLKIILHGVDLKVTHALLRQNAKDVKPIKISHKPLEDSIVFDFVKPIAAGMAEFDLKFTGLIGDKMVGFYRSKYLVSGEERFMASTQFESTDARRAFFCVDEPSAKAVFDLTFLVHPSHTVVSNTHIESIREHESGYKLVSFAPTPKMSTYLVAYVIGDLEFLETKTREGTVIRVFVTPGKKKQAKFALETAARMLSFYNDYFGIPYPMAVLDLIAIPDFAAGAMENWGAITYRETALLIDPEHSAASAKQRVAIVIAHELAHQWFGNLVTMEWWTHLWLNEGFASWIEYLAVDHLFPEWQIWTQFVYSDLNRALELDALRSTHPVEVPVGHPKEINEIFDAISYSKGASVIRMLADYLGKNDFRKGLNHYLNKHKYNNATTEDLWKALEETSGRSVQKLMRRWTDTSGYPVVSVQRSRGGGDKTKEKRFFSSALENKRAGAKNLWTIPIGYTTDVSNKKKYVLMTKSATSIPENISESGWINLNANQSGMFRVRYDSDFLAALRPAIVKRRIGPADRLGLINDSFALARAGYTDTAKILRLLSAYKNEDSYAVWRDMATQLDDLDNLLYGQGFYPTFQEYIRSIFASVVKKVGWESKQSRRHYQDEADHLDALLRELVLAQAGKYGDGEVLKEARYRFNNYARRGKNISPDLRAVVYSLTARAGDKKEFEDLLRLYKKAILQEEKNRLAAALCQFKQPPLIKRALNFILSKEVRNQDAPLLLAAAAGNNAARSLTWEFIKDNWPLLYRRYSGGHLLGRIITDTTSDLDTFVAARDVERFFKKNMALGTERAVAQSIERIKSNAAWKKAASLSRKKFFN